ncbi:polysaccharide deacetylase [Maribacter algarum]|uniref:Polysaccharide deacetylase n=1 Tax=Maribacter algarum (ex Zhang et al. 2020) TaxID=2578118 RepID=A0A5S3PI00_9FLAO|nr:polysaccharide deacetylase family protein [Maribacter algarum]TMM53910.1 polysaccharide deacetylase [Maribacter algarum]
MESKKCAQQNIRAHAPAPRFRKWNAIWSKTSFLFLFVIISACAQNQDEFKWPNGVQAAICLTYDDGLPSHIQTAAPMLDRYNFKGTFYPTLSSESLYMNMDEWKALTANGHELGNHSVYHPCSKSDVGMEWVADYHDLDSYTHDQIVEELKLANSFLLAMDGLKERTFAYPCAHTAAGGETYKDHVSQDFSAARGSSEKQSNLVSPLEIDLFDVPSWAPNQHDGKALIDYVDKIIKNKTLSTLTFHGIGAEHMRVSKKAHEELLMYLDENRDKIWVATFKEATDYLNSKRAKK